MKKSRPPLLPTRFDSAAYANASQSRTTRTCVLSLATAAAALGLVGCSSMSTIGTTHEPAPLTNQQQLASDRVKQFTNNIDIALDQVDRERLRAAAEKKNQVAAGQSPVLLATSTTSTGPEPLPQTAAPAATAQPLPATPDIVPPIKTLVTTTVTGPAFSALSPAAEATPTAPAVADPLPVHVTVKTNGAPSPAVERAQVIEKPQVAERPPVVERPQIVERPLPAAAVPQPLPEKPIATLATAAPVHADLPAVISPIAPPPLSPPSAMGAMTAMVMPMPEKIEVPTSLPPSPAVTPVLAPAPAPVSLEDAMDVMRKRIAANPSLNSALALALLDTGDGKAAEAPKSLSPADQKVFADLLAALQGMNDPAATGTSATLADRAAPLVNAAKKWQADADLALPRLALASRVDSFGVYTALEPKFEQGKKRTVIIYCEVANFSSKKSDDGWFQTTLTQQETLITDDGLLVWRPNAEEVDDKSLNQRHDFYLVKKLTIPENLATGKYTLRMSVTDRATNKIAMVSLPIEIVGK